MLKRIVTILCLICLTLSLAGCGTKDTTAEPAEKTDKLRVVVSFNAMRELAQAVGGDCVDIKTIVPDGAEPHDFEPKATDLTALAQARVFILNGMGMEHAWAGKAIQAAGNDSLIVVTASEPVEPITVTAKPFPFRRQETSLSDPHTWLSLKNAAIESRRMRDAFIEADPAHRKDYEANEAAFQEKLAALQQEYAGKFAKAKKPVFVTGHAAFGYMARDFGLHQASLTDVFAAGEPSARHLKELADFCKENNIKVIFVENMENPKIAQTLAEETGAAVDSLDTLESSQPGEDYLSIMQDNLEKIAGSMG